MPGERTCRALRNERNTSASAPGWDTGRLRRRRSRNLWDDEWAGRGVCVSVSVCGEESEAVSTLQPHPSPSYPDCNGCPDLSSRDIHWCFSGQSSFKQFPTPTLIHGENAVICWRLLILELRDALLETRFWFGAGKGSLHLPVRVGPGAGEGPLQVTGEMASISGALGGGDRSPCSPAFPGGDGRRER